MENIVVKEITPNKDKTIIDIKLENDEVIKAFKTKYSPSGGNLYTLGGGFDSQTVLTLYNELHRCRQFFIDCLENCFQEHCAGGIVQIPDDKSAKEFFEECRKNEETYQYQELDSITEQEKNKRLQEECGKTKEPIVTEQEKNKRLQEEYGKAKELIGFFNNMAQQNGTQVAKK